MPIPKPSAGESHAVFMSRCMADDVMTSEYPDDDQRYAVCETSWGKKDDGPDRRGEMTTASDVKLLTRRMEVKQVDIGGRTFEGLAATWDRDLGGDIIEKGAFRKTIREWKKSGRILPLLDSHNWFSVRDTVGKLIAAEERDEGLWTKWLIVPGTDGDEILARLRSDDEHGAFIDSMSIGYRPVKFKIIDPGEEDKEEEFSEPTRLLQEIELHEVSLVLFPMNPAARIDSASVKTMAGTIRLMLDRCPEELKEEARRALRCELDGIGPVNTDPPIQPVPEAVPVAPPAVKKMPPDYGIDPPDEGVPDMTLFDRLRLKQLSK